MRKNSILLASLTMLFSMIDLRAFAYDIAAENEDGVTIYYNLINDGLELEVTKGENSYTGIVVIPSEVSSMKVTAIGEQAFYGCEKLESIIFNENLKSIGGRAFSSCIGLTSVVFPQSLETISAYAFTYCVKIKSITFGNNLTAIYDEAFYNCSSLESVVIPNSVKTLGPSVFENCESLTSLTLGDGLTATGAGLARDCKALSTVVFGKNVKTIGRRAFMGCTSLETLSIPGGVMSIGEQSFSGCSSLHTISLPNTITDISGKAFEDDVNLQNIISLITNPFNLKTTAFPPDAYDIATLYVPNGTKEKYMAKDGWSQFSNIIEGADQCAKPIIKYEKGKLQFTSETEGVEFISSITDNDIKEYASPEIELSVTYNVSVYATKLGYANSETATGTLCWIEVDPQAEGIETGVAEVRSVAVLIKSENGRMTVEGASDGTPISVYSTDGILLGSIVSRDRASALNTNLPKGSVAVVKIGQKAVKVVVN